MRGVYKYEYYTAEQKIGIVLAGLRHERSVRDLCRQYEISKTLFYRWRGRLLESGRVALSTPTEVRKSPAAEVAELKKRISGLEQALGRKTYELEIARNRQIISSRY